MSSDVGLPTRREVLAVSIGTSIGTALAAAGGLAVTAPAQAHPGPPGPDPVAAAEGFLTRMASVYAPAGEPRLAQSYADQLGLFSTAFVYDNAVAICAGLALGTPAGRRLAVELGDGLLYAQAHDPAYDDGRLRQAYNVGPYVFYDGNPQPDRFVLPDGHANIGWQFGFLGTAVGDLAWPGIALVQLAIRERQRRFLDGALRMAHWILEHATNPGTLGGYSFGVDRANNRVPNVSTEHNLDVYGFFRMLAEVTHDRAWDARAEAARALVGRMWEPAGGFFATGSNDGSTVNPTPRPLDPQTWGWLSLRDRRRAGALDWAARTLAVTDTPAAANSQLPAGVSVSGVTFSDAALTSTASYNGIPVDRHGVWLEGTAQLATALADRGAPGDRAAARRHLTQLRLAQTTLGQGQTAGGAALPAGGIVAASSLLDTGFGFGYFQVQHVGATGWYLLAEHGANPFRPLRR